MNKHNSKLLVLVFFCSIATAFGQDVWEKKPYQEWTREEALQVLSESPWSQKKVMELSTDKPFESVNIPLATVRLRSGLPIRQALVRLKQLKTKYDKLSAEGKARVDGETKALLECSLCTKFYVVAIEVGAGADLKEFEKLSEDERKFIFIENNRSERRDLVSVVREDREIFLFFPRLDDHGKALLTLETSEVHLFINTRALRKRLFLLIPALYSFDVTKLIRGNEILF